MIFILLKHSTEHCKGQFSIIKRSLNSAPGFIQPFINSNLADMAVYCPHSSSCSQSIDCLWACIPKSYCPEWLQIQLTWVVKTFNGLWWAANQEQGNQVLLLTSAVLQNLQRLLITVFTDKHKTSADLLFLMFVSPVCSIRLFVSPSCFMLLLLSVWFNHQHWTVLLLLKKKKTKQWKSHFADTFWPWQMAHYRLCCLVLVQHESEVWKEFWKMEIRLRQPRTKARLSFDEWNSVSSHWASCASVKMKNMGGEIFCQFRY